MNKEEVIEEVYCKLHRAGYHMGWVDGTEHGVAKVKAAMDWFKATYNTEYVLYDSDSITHLLDMYKDSFQAMHDTAEEIGDNIVREDK